MSKLRAIGQYINAKNEMFMAKLVDDRWTYNDWEKRGRVDRTDSIPELLLSERNFKFKLIFIYD